MAITLTDEQVAEMLDRIEHLMYNWHPDPQRSDHRCEFCGNTAEKNHGPLKHRPDCDGEKFLTWLSSNEPLNEECNPSR